MCRSTGTIDAAFERGLAGRKLPRVRALARCHAYPRTGWLGRTLRSRSKYWGSSVEAVNGTSRELTIATSAVSADIDRTHESTAAFDARAVQRRIAESDLATRRRIARDLHDGAQQRLVNLLVALRLADQQLPSGSAAGELVKVATAEACAAIEELRELTTGLHPAILTYKGLVAAVEALAARSLLPVTVAAVVDIRLPAHVEATAYFLVAEALTNVAKHANASEVLIELKSEGRTLEVSVQDDGVGGAAMGRGSGLIGIADRVEALGGTLMIESMVGVGTCLRVSVPSDRPG